MTTGQIACYRTGQIENPQHPPSRSLWRTMICDTIYPAVSHRFGTMKTLTIREAREGLSHPEQMFANDEEVLVVCRGEPVARILPAHPKAKARPLAAFRAKLPFQEIPAKVLIRLDRDGRG